MGRTTHYHQISNKDLSRVVVMVQRGRADLDQALVWARPRQSHFQHFALEAKFVSRTNRTRPAEFIESRADDAARRLELASDQEPHCHGCGVPAASRQSAEHRLLRGLLVEMEGMRIEVGGEPLDLFLVDHKAPGAEGLPTAKSSKYITVIACAPRTRRADALRGSSVIDPRPSQP